MLWKYMTDHSSFITRWFENMIRRDSSAHKENLHPSIDKIQSDQIAALSRQLEIEKRRNAQLVLLNELSQQLETRLDQPVAAQLAVNTLERAIECLYVCLLIHEPEQREFVALASAGRMSKLIPPGYRQNGTQGMN